MHLFNMLISRNVLFKRPLLITYGYIAKLSSQPAMERQINIDGQNINYIKVGEGKQKLLCFPGALGTIWSDFKPQIDGLDKSTFTVIAWDPPGYGHSRPPNRIFNEKFYETDAEAAYKLMNQIGIRKFSLLGWSDGGISSMILAAKYPKSVEKLVIWGANAYVTPDEAKLYKKMEDISNWSEKMKSPLVALYTEQGLQKMWSDWVSTLINMSNAGGDVCKGRLKEIESPTFILHGDLDPMVAPEHPDYLVSNIKEAKLHRFPKGKHNIHLRYAEEFNKLVTEFLLQ